MSANEPASLLLEESTTKSALTIVQMTSPQEAALILPLLRSWHEESQYSHLPLSEGKFLTHMVKALARGKDGALFYAIWRGEVVGMTDVAAGEAWLHVGGRYASCLTWYVHPRLRATFLGARIAKRLHNHVKDWATNSGAAALFVNGTSGANNSLRRLGTLMGHNVSISLIRT